MTGWQRVAAGRFLCRCCSLLGEGAHWRFFETPTLSTIAYCPTCAEALVAATSTRATLRS